MTWTTVIHQRFDTNTSQLDVHIPAGHHFPTSETETQKVPFSLHQENGRTCSCAAPAAAAALARLLMRVYETTSKQPLWFYAQLYGTSV